MVERTFSNVKIECVQGDITEQNDMDAVVNAANAQLKSGGGVAGALHSAAGPELAKEGREHAPIKPGEAVLTRAYKLPNKFVIHCLGPVYGQDEPADRLLADCYRNALQLAENKEIHSIAFPSLSTGAFGYPVKEAAAEAVKAIVSVAPDLSTVSHIRFVLFSESDYQVYAQALEQA